MAATCFGYIKLPSSGCIYQKHKKKVVYLCKKEIIYLYRLPVQKGNDVISFLYFRYIEPNDGYLDVAETCSCSLQLPR